MLFCRSQWPCQKDLRSLVAVLEATTVAHERQFTSFNLIHTYSKIVMSADNVFIIFCNFLEKLTAVWAEF